MSRLSLSARVVLTALAWVLAPGLTARAAAAPAPVDVCVYGGTAGGVVAAVAARQAGKSVLLVEPGRHLGGMTSGGLGWTDFGNKAAIGGMSLDFYRRVGREYGRDEAVWTFEPGVAERVLRAWVAEAKVDVLFEHRLTAVDEEGGRIRTLTLEHAPPQPSGAPAPNPRQGTPAVVVRAKMFIDCTYEGDLLAAAGVQYAVGRESVQKYNEPLNGIRAHTPSHQFKTKVDPYRTPGDPASGLLPLIQEGDGGTPGDGDHRVQAYNFRLCLTRDPANRVEITAPDGYDPARYELLARHVESMVAAGMDVRLSQLLKIDMVTPQKTDINNNGAVSTDFIGQNWDYPDADYATRGRIWNEHLNYIQGLLYFLGHGGRIPKQIRDDMNRWGLCKDEFQDTGGWPHQMYVREARRMMGRYVITQADCEHRTTADDAVGLGAYNMDSHNCQRVVQDGVVRNEGDVQVAPAGPYPIPYRAITPKAEQCENLLVPVCLSASHIAYGSARMEPVFMVMGQSAAMAACQAIDGDTNVQSIDVKKLQQRLLAAGQVLEAPAGAVRGVKPAALGGVVVDDADKQHAELTGPWKPSVGRLPGHVGAGYLHDGDADKGKCLARFTVPVDKAGTYDVRMAYTSHPNRATNVPVKVTAGGRTRELKVNQRQKPPIAPGFIPLGVFTATSGGTIVVEVGNAGTDGHVVADAVQAVPVRE